MSEACHLCPRRCGVLRAKKKGFCQASDQIMVARAALHHWEEPCISGENGSGTVFFSHCNLKCVFCQNSQISQEGFGMPVSEEQLVQIFFRLQGRGAHNINLVTPTHYIPQIRRALIQAKEQGLTIPVVYNSNAYESVESLKTLEGLIDIYLPDIKYCSDEYSTKYSQAPHYFEAATQAVLEMFRQVGTPMFDEKGIMVKGLMIRHLMLPGLLFDSKKIVDWVLEKLPKQVYLNIMCQYTPLNQAWKYPEINRKLNRKHYEGLINYAVNKGLEAGFYQDQESATEEYVPDFDLSGVIKEG